MSTTFHNEGKRMPYTNATSATISSGDVVVLTDMIGIAIADIAASDTGVLDVSGVHLLDKASGAITQGQQLYWDASSENLTTSSTGNEKAGRAWAAASTAATTAYVLLNSNA